MPPAAAARKHKNTVFLRIPLISFLPENGRFILAKSISLSKIAIETMLQTKLKNFLWQVSWGYERKSNYDNDSNYNKVLQPIYLSNQRLTQTNLSVN